MTRHVHGHTVTLDPCDGLARHWRAAADGEFIGLVALAGPGDWSTAPAVTPGRPCGPVCHCPSLEAALVTLIAETIERP